MSSTIRKFYDVEHDEILTLEELQDEFSAKDEEEKEEFAGNFWLWLQECTGKNGTLEAIA